MIALLVPLLLATAAPARAAPDTVPYRTEDVRYRNGDVELAAALLLPRESALAGSEGMPAAVILQGSGPVDRTNWWAGAIADRLARSGLAVLLTDKRGSGASGGDWRTAGFDDLAADGLAGVALLRARPDVDPARVGLIGLSQGGWVAPLAAARAPEEVAFVVNVSGASVTLAEQSFVEMANTTRQAGLTEEAVAGVLELNRLAARYLTTDEWEPYARAREAGRSTAWEAIAEGFPGEPDAPIWTFLRQVADFDPLPYWLQLRQPVLVLYGEEDERDNVPVAESVRRLEFAFRIAHKENAEVIVIPGAGHGFLDMERHGLMREFEERLAAWVASHLRP